MASLSRKKSVKNIILRMQSKRKQLHIDQLKTQPPSQSNKFKISFQKLYQRYGTGQKQKIFHQQVIDNMATKLYDQNLILLDNEIQCNQKKEYLKRFYYEWEYQQKISLLGEYYKFHVDQPRIFHKDLHQIVFIYQQDKRQLEYQNVKEKIQQQKQPNQNHDQHALLSKVNSNKNVLKSDQNKKKCQFILKDLLKAYEVDNKVKKNTQQIKKANEPKATNGNKEKILHKMSSFNSKKMSSSHSERNTINFGHKNQKKITSIQDASQKQMKKLQSKYTEIINEMFRKKRSSSKTTNQIKKIQNKLLEKSRKASESRNRIVSSRQDKINLQESKKKYASKVVRSKSQSHMKCFQVQQSMKTHQKFISVKPMKISQLKDSKKEKILTSRQSQKRFKNSPNQSKKNRQTSINSKEYKTVKVFQITKKDLISDDVNKEQKIVNTSRQQQLGKQNEGNRIINKQQSTITQQKLNKKENNSLKQANKIDIKSIKLQNKGNSMFSRVIKNKIRS